jgi:FeS assembly SUF system regulator
MFRLSRLTDYAVALLARMANEGKVWAAPDLAQQSGLPLPTVAKILKQLSKAGVLSAQRGANGGYRLSLPPLEISIAAIVEAMDGPIAITDCADTGDHNCQVEALCPMSGGWNKVNQAIRSALSNLSLAEMADITTRLPTPQTMAIPRETSRAAQAGN